VGGLFGLRALAAPARDADGYGTWSNALKLVNPLPGADCCGLDDCKEVPAGGVEAVSGGYLDKETGDTISYSNVLWKSPDGHWWHCLGSRETDSDGLTWGKPVPFTRCLIGPPPSS